MKRVSPEESVPLHVQITRDESFRVTLTCFHELHLNQVRNEEKGELGVRYGPEEGDWLDLYNEKGPGDLVAYLTGGYWQVTPPNIREDDAEFNWPFTKHKSNI